MKRTLNTNTMTGLWRVRMGRTLLWPAAAMPALVNRMNKRGVGGYVVDMDTPHEKALCRGYEKFFEEVPADEDAQTEARAKVVPTADFPRPVISSLVERNLAKRTQPKRRPKSPATVAASNEQRTSKPGELPALDEAPKGGRTRRSRRPTEEGGSDAAQGDASAPGA